MDNPNCGQRVADDNAWVQKSICWFFGCICSKSPEPKGLSNMLFTLVIQGQACMEGKASHGHRSFLSQFSCLLPAHDRQVCSPAFQNGILQLWMVSAENTLIGNVSAVVDFSRSGLVHSITVLFEVRSRLCFGAVLCHLVVVFFSIFTCTFCLAIPPRCLQGDHFKSCSVAFNFLQKCQSASCVAERLTKMLGFPYDRNQLFLYAVLKVSPDWCRRGTTRCNPVLQHTMFMAGKVCFS